MSSDNSRGRWVAIVTGAISIAIAVAYLALIMVLDARGPLLPPPPEALGLSSATFSPDAGGEAADFGLADVAGVPPHG